MAELSAYEKELQIQEKDLADLWASLIDNEGGRFLLFSILDKCGCFNFDYDGPDYDKIKLGRQQVGGEVLADFVFPNGMRYYADMLLEAEARAKRLEQAEKTTETQDDMEQTS